MKAVKTSIVLFFFLCIAQAGFSQTIPDNITAALKGDDSVTLATLVTKDNINTCYQDGNFQYSLLAQAIRHHAIKCFNLLIAQNADVNKSCNGYVPPIMHAVKYGPLAVVKVLVSKGADINYKYEGTYTPANGETPASYAAKCNQPEIASYLQSLKPKQ